MQKRKPRGKYNITAPNRGWFAEQGKKIKGSCLICGTEFMYYPSQRVKKYCSITCYRVSQKGKKRPKHSEWMKDAHKKGLINSDSLIGRKHSKEERENTSKRMKERWRDKDDPFNSDEYRQNLSDQAMKMRKEGKFNNSGHSTNRGWFLINGNTYYFKSGWEVLYARYLEWLKENNQIKKWEYEPETFWFESIRRGVRSYLPDYRVTNNNDSIEYHEVKGWMDDKSKTKIKRMAKYYPSTVLKVFQRKEIAGIKKMEKLYPEAKEIEKPKK